MFLFFYYEGNPVITLEGFKYPLVEYKLDYKDTLCVSNEILEEFGNVKVRNGKIIVVHSIHLK